MTTVDTGLMADLRRFGAAEINACFSCGNCTAICPLADDDATFPRRIIRLAQVGLADELVSSKELWTCYQCGRCTNRCPQEADPAEFMATARRWAIARLDKTRIARAMYTNVVLGAIIVVIGAVIFGAFFAAVRDRSAESANPRLVLFDFIPNTVVHTVGLVLIIVVFLYALFTIGTLARGFMRKDGVTAKSLFGGGAAWKRTWRAFWYAVGIESLGQKRYREDCEDDDPIEPLYRRRWLIHALTIWGFLGLFLATILDYGLELLGLKDPNNLVPIWYPVRLLGTIAGLSLIYGVVMLGARRYRKTKAGTLVSKPTDWLFLGLLFVIGLTGFVIEVALYVQPVQVWGYWVFLVHVAFAMELVLFLPFTKLAHAMYRPVALFFYGLAKQPAVVAA